MVNATIRCLHDGLQRPRTDAESHRTRHRARQYPLRLRIEPNRTSAGRRSHTGGSYYTNSSPSARHTIPCRQLISRVDASFFSCAEDDECASSSTSIASWRWTFCTDNRDPCWFVRCYKKIDKVLELRWFTGANTISSQSKWPPTVTHGTPPTPDARQTGGSDGGVAWEVVHQHLHNKDLPPTS